MSQCKDWWNDDWRDRILATMNWLADEDGRIVVELSSNVVTNVAKLPLYFTSPVSYIEPGASVGALEEADAEETYETEEDSDEDE